MSSEAQQTPLLDMLRAVPADARAEYEHDRFHHSMIPYGRLCADAAREIAERDEEIKRLRDKEFILLEEVAKTTASLISERQRAVESVAACMMRHGLSTGHGESLEGLLAELGEQIGEMRQRREGEYTRMPDIPSEKVLSAISESLFNASFLHGSSDVPTDIYEAILRELKEVFNNE